MKITDILAVAGKPGLYQVLAPGRASIVVESMLDGKRSSVPGTARVSNLADITMYTHDDDVLKLDILNRMHDAWWAPKVLLTKTLRRPFVILSTALSSNSTATAYQRTKKLVQWYNLLGSKGAFPLEAPEKPEEAPAEEAPKKEAKAEKKPAKKAAAKKPAAKKKEA